MRQDILHEFVLDTNDQLDQNDRDVLLLEDDPTSAEPLRRLFRTVHTIKGTCGFLHLGPL